MMKNDNELCFKMGDRIRFVAPAHDGWFIGLVDGKTGLVSKTFVEPEGAPSSQSRSGSEACSAMAAGEQTSAGTDSLTETGNNLEAVSEMSKKHKVEEHVQGILPKVDDALQRNKDGVHELAEIVFQTLPKPPPVGAMPSLLDKAGEPHAVAATPNSFLQAQEEANRPDDLPAQAIAASTRNPPTARIPPAGNTGEDDSSGGGPGEDEDAQDRAAVKESTIGAGVGLGGGGAGAGAGMHLALPPGPSASDNFPALTTTMVPTAQSAPVTLPHFPLADMQVGSLGFQPMLVPGTLANPAMLGTPNLARFPLLPLSVGSYSLASSLPGPVAGLDPRFLPLLQSGPMGLQFPPSVLAALIPQQAPASNAGSNMYNLPP
mmetsp:Transcript_60651/g.124862  ORF Transcript_60651/g.124862 Transcript_60651/m.124862 type:complete len:375 (-) Transcript_60651:1712-2836(-)